MIQEKIMVERKERQPVTQPVQRVRKQKVRLLMGCVIEGRDCEEGETVELPFAEAFYLRDANRVVFVD